MSKRTSTLLLAAFTCIAAFAWEPVNRSGYNLVWSDEFNNGALNTEVWNIETNGNGGGNNELQYYCDRGVRVGTDAASGEGCLILTATKENYGGRTCTSGRVNTMGKVYFKHGKVEARIKMPSTANGLWPAYWMLGNDYPDVNWPRCGEIDICEMGNGNGISAGTQDRYFNGACHWGFYNDQGQYPNYANAVTWDYSLQDGQFHTFTLYWDNNYVTMYCDEAAYPNRDPYYQMGVSDVSGDWSTGLYFQKPFFLLFNLAVGGNFMGYYDINQVTALNSGSASMYIDYVRVYQQGNSTDTFVGPTSDNAAISVVEAAAQHVFIADNVLVVPTEVTSLRLFDLQGHEVMHTTEHNVSAKLLTPGMYIAVMQHTDGTTTQQKLIKQ